MLSIELYINSSIESNSEKHKLAEKKYREANRKKRSDAARLSKLRKQLKDSEELNEAMIEKKAKELMDEKKRK